VSKIASAFSDEERILVAVSYVTERKARGENEKEDRMQNDRGSEEIEAGKHGHRNWNAKHRGEQTSIASITAEIPDPAFIIEEKRGQHDDQ